MSIFFIKKPILTLEQIQRLSNILDNAGQVVFGIAVLTPLIAGFDKTNWIVVGLGLAGVMILWAFSITIAKKEDFYE